MKSMNYFNLSEKSDSIFEKPQKGGFKLFSNDYSNLLFDAINENELDVLIFLVKNKAVTDLSYKDTNGQTVLHHVVDKFNKNPAKYKEILRCILTRPDIKKIINIQDKDGNTPLHIAVIKENDKLADILIRKGADTSIKNKAGSYIDSESDVDLESLYNTNVESVKNSKENEFVDKLIDSVTSNRDEQLSVKNRDEITEYQNTSDFVSELVEDYKTQIFEKNTQQGGKSKSKMELPIFSMTSDVEAVSSDNDSEKLQSELSRMINNQSTEIHERSIKKIMDLLKIDEIEAKAYKAMVYSEVKKEHPELNNFDRAVEMEKQITLEYLKKLSKNKKQFSEISDYLKQKSSEYMKKKEEHQKDKDGDKDKDEDEDEDKDEDEEKKEKKKKKIDKLIKKLKRMSYKD